MSVKLATTGKGIGDVGHILSDIEKTWKGVNPNEPLEFAFYDDTIASFYEKEQKTAQIISAAMAMAIFISCMGLFGLAVFTTKQRTREIGIRKVLGASVSNILVILSAGFLRLVGIAALIASPIAWYAMNRWLEGFAYHTPIRWWIFVLAGLLAALIALITISMQAIKVARANPVNSIKTE
jgi:ABC-type antimicrobial peptide transport system permease subunit